MKTKTHTFYFKRDCKKCFSERRKLKLETLRKRGASLAWYEDIDTYNPSKGYFNKRKIFDENEQI